MRMKLFLGRRAIVSAISAVIVALLQWSAIYFSERYSIKDIPAGALRALEWFACSFVVIYLIYSAADWYLSRGSARDGNADRSFWKELFLPFGVMVLCWGTCFLLFRPAFVVSDTIRSIMTGFHLPVGGQGRTLVDGVEYHYNSAFPLFGTFLYSGFYKLGIKLGYVKIGVHLFAICQMFFAAMVFSWAFYTLLKNGVSRMAVNIAFVFTALSPFVALYTMGMLVDVLYALMIVIDTTLVFRLVASGPELLKDKKYLAQLTCALLFTCLSKPAAKMLVFALLLILLIVYRRKYKYLLFVFATIFLLFSVGVERVAYKALKVKKVGAQESLSIPFMQTARFFRNHPEKVTKKEFKAVDRVLNAKKIAEIYNPRKSDEVKNTFREEATSADMKKYFKVWRKQMRKSPRTYMATFLEHQTQYWQLVPEHYYYYTIFTDARTRSSLDNVLDGYRKFYKSIGRPQIHRETAMMRYNLSESQVERRSALAPFVETLRRTPVISNVYSIGFSFVSVIVIGIYFIYKKRNAELLILAMAFFTMIGCAFSPVNGNYRYALPVTFAMPIFYAIVFRRGAGQKEEPPRPEK